ncbi:hypothetical protein BJ165DRAFT_1074473 [Panaeolus papilionaceus]|nr:hypothetical protein BJ165DRAFT_1074473 [Panaeolus papilionaceus]
MPQDLRQPRRGMEPEDPGEPPLPPPVNTSIEPLLSTLDELRMCMKISTLSEQSQLQLQDELRDMLLRLQASTYPSPQTHPQSTPVLPANSGPTSGPSKIGIFGGQVTFVNTVHNGDDAERAKHSVSLRILALLSVLLLDPSAHSLFFTRLSGGNSNNSSGFSEFNTSKPAFFCKLGPQLELFPNIMRNS